ncbi:MAG: DNA gyrase subunit A [Clostridia bacterium]|nr:DNA gyrase subunit A [Clostridia bacterium]
MNIIEGEHIIDVDVNQEVRDSFLQYAMSVIVSRALPDVRDGLKPVHRRILFSSFEDGHTPDKPYNKSAATVGTVLAKYHPHGDASVYDAMVRLAQDFSLRYPLIDGQGNFGSIDGDAPAAYRYTEARLDKMSMHLLSDIYKDTVDFIPSFDDKRKEPEVLPSRFPNLLVNGSTGIAVGMATSIPPHNLCEVIDAITMMLDNPECEIGDIMEIIQGPDFPTGGVVMGKAGIRAAYYTGRSKITLRAKARIEETKNDRYQIVVTEIPYMVNKAKLVESIAECHKTKRVEGIDDLHDNTGRNGLEIIIKLKKDANPQVVLNQLFSYTQLQTTVSVIMLALVNGQPKVLNLKEMLEEYINFQREVITRRTRFDLKKAQDRAHILEGYRKALDYIDEVVRIIRASKTIAEAKSSLMERFEFSDIQAQRIVEMRLGQLTGLSRQEIDDEYAEKLELIKDYTDILANPARVDGVIKEEINEIKDKFGDERRTEICPISNEIDIEDLIEEEECVITLTHFGYIKRLPVNTYKAQHRGGRGITAMTTREEDFVEELFMASTHDIIMFFTSKGRVYKLKGYEIPESSRTAKGMNIINLLEMDSDEKISAMIKIRNFENQFLVMVTKNGIIKRTAIEEYATTRKGGVRAIVLDEDDELVKVELTSGEDNLIVGTRGGQAIRFSEDDVRTMGRVTRGVRGIKLKDEDYVIGMNKVNDEGKLLIVTENGFAKRTEISEYKLQARGGKGVTSYALSDKTGLVAGMNIVKEDEDIMMISSDGIIIRMPVSEVNVYKRVTQGVKVMRLNEGVTVVTIGKTAKEEEDSSEEIEEETSSEE